MSRDGEAGTSASILDHDLELKENNLLISAAGSLPAVDGHFIHNATQPVYKTMKSKSCLKWVINVDQGLQ